MFAVTRPAMKGGNKTTPEQLPLGRGADFRVSITLSPSSSPSSHANPGQLACNRIRGSGLKVLLTCLQAPVTAGEQLSEVTILPLKC